MLNEINDKLIKLKDINSSVFPNLFLKYCEAKMKQKLRFDLTSFFQNKLA